MGSSARGRFEAAHGFELRFVGCPVEVEVVAGGEAGVIDDGLVHDCALHVVAEVLHGGVGDNEGSEFSEEEVSGVRRLVDGFG